MLDIQSVSGPTLSSGNYTFTFGNYEQVNNALVTFDDPAVSSYAYAASTTISGDTVVVNIKKQNLGSPGGWSNAGNSDITGKITCIADCD